MNWLEIVKLLVVLWPIIEKIIAAIDGEENKAKATNEAIAAVVQIATSDKRSTVPVSLVAAVRAANNVA